MNEWKRAQPTMSRQWGQGGWTSTKKVFATPKQSFEKVKDEAVRKHNIGKGGSQVNPQPTRGGGRGGFLHNWAATVRELVGGRGSRTVSIRRMTKEERDSFGFQSWRRGQF